MDVTIEMVADLARIKSPLPRGVSGFLEILGAFLSRAPRALAGWLFYGALVLIAANLLGGTARLPDFLGMVGLLNLLGPILCLGALLWLVGLIWSVVVYVKAVSVVSGLDTGKSIVAVFAPAVAILLLGILLAILAVLWLIIIF